MTRSAQRLVLFLLLLLAAAALAAPLAFFGPPPSSSAIAAFSVGAASPLPPARLESGATIDPNG